jgi:hypothetical protein
MTDIILTPNQQIPRDTRLRLYADAGDGTHVPLVGAALTPDSLAGLEQRVEDVAQELALILETVRPPTMPDILYAEIVAAVTEYSIDFNIPIRRLVISNRTGNAFRLAFVPGYVAAPLDLHLEIPAGAAYDTGPVDWAGVIYFAGVAGDELQFEYWR